MPAHKRRRRKRLPQPNILLAWCALTLYCDFIFFLSSLETPPLGIRLYFHTDKLAHGVEYAVLGVLLAWTFFITFRFRSWKALMTAAMVVGALIAVSDEWHQSYVPGRNARLGDLVADGVGLWAGMALWRRRRQNA